MADNYNDLIKQLNQQIASNTFDLSKWISSSNSFLKILQNVGDAFSSVSTFNSSLNDMNSTVDASSKKLTEITNIINAIPTLAGSVFMSMNTKNGGGLIRLINSAGFSPFLATVKSNSNVYELCF